MDAVREILPKVGRIRRVSLRYQKRSARYDQVLAGHMVNTFDPTMAGGVLMDLGVYCVHAMITLFGPPQHVTGASIPVASGVDGAGAVLAGYPGFIVDLFQDHHLDPAQRDSRRRRDPAHRPRRQPPHAHSPTPRRTKSNSEC